MRLELLVDGPEFLAGLRRDLPQARRHLYAQFLTFEGDDAGRAFHDVFSAAPAPDRRLVIDCFSKHFVSDRCVRTPSNLLDASLRAERREGERLVRGLRQGGTRVRYVNPFGLLLQNLLCRNHKKLVLLDDRVAYIGGINVSDHNFAWHDLMVRIEDPAAASFLREDFLATWSGLNRPSTGRFAGLTLHAFDGRHNALSFRAVFERLAGARRSVFVQCPYLTEPFLGALQAAARRGVAVTVIVPERNNQSIIGDRLAGEARRGDLDLRFYPGRMTHMKAMLVDGEVLLTGSTNFDFISYYQQEYLAEITDPGLVAAFRERIEIPDLARARRSAPTPSAAALLWARCSMAVLEGATARA